jgi:hypothetical protein
MDKKYLRQVALYVLSVILSIGLILYIGYHLFYGLTQKTETATATVATVGSALEMDVYIFRDEIPLTSSSAGSCVPSAADGEKVGVGRVVASLYEASSPDTVSRIAGLEKQISVLEQIKSSNLSVRDTASIDAEIYGIVENIVSAARRGDGGSILSLRSSLISEWNRRASLTGSAADVDGAIEKLRAEKDTLTKSLGPCRQQITASRSGYYYASCDGYESVFTAERALNMSLSEFRALTRTAPDTAVTAGKLAVSYTWYAVGVASREAGKELIEGKTYPVTFLYNEEKTLLLTLLRIVEEDGQAMLVFRGDTLPTDFRLNRSQPVSMVHEENTGLRIPASALRSQNGVTGVYIRHGSTVYYRAVEIILEEEDWCLVEIQPEKDPPEGYTWLQQNDIVITKGRGLYDGRVLS